MKLQQYLQSYDFDEILPAVNEMFPGTAKFRNELQQAYDIMVQMCPVENGKAIRYKLIKAGTADQYYYGAEDSCFQTTWESALGKRVSRDKGVDLSDLEIVANCLVNLCLQGRGPREFEPARQRLLRG